MKDRYIFPAFFCHYDDAIGVVFHDLPGCVSQGDNDEDALRMANEALRLHLWGMEEDGDAVPEPTPVKQLHTNHDQTVVLIEAYMPPFRELMHSRSTTRAVTLPKWLDMEAKSARLNYSQVLQDGLMKRLGFSHRRSRVKV